MLSVKYVNQDSYTNTIEGLFFNFNRMIIGIIAIYKTKSDINEQSFKTNW